MVGDSGADVHEVAAGEESVHAVLELGARLDRREEAEHLGPAAGLVDFLVEASDDFRDRRGRVVRDAAGRVLDDRFRHGDVCDQEIRGLSQRSRTAESSVPVDPGLTAVDVVPVRAGARSSKRRESERLYTTYVWDLSRARPYYERGWSFTCMTRWNVIHVLGNRSEPGAELVLDPLGK